MTTSTVLGEALLTSSVATVSLVAGCADLSRPEGRTGCDGSTVTCADRRRYTSIYACTRATRLEPYGYGDADMSFMVWVPLAGLRRG